jgi:catechol 2,3-dioxygenase-like lactoylglutathione lyase family enzyme
MSMADNGSRRLDHVGLNVADLAAAQAWCAEAFGYERATWPLGSTPSSPSGFGTGTARAGRARGGAVRMTASS